MNALHTQESSILMYQFQKYTRFFFCCVWFGVFCYTHTHGERIDSVINTYMNCACMYFGFEYIKMFPFTFNQHHLNLFNSFPHIVLTRQKSTNWKFITHISYIVYGFKISFSRVVTSLICCHCLLATFPHYFCCYLFPFDIFNNYFQRYS